MSGGGNRAIPFDFQLVMTYFIKVIKKSCQKQVIFETSILFIIKGGINGDK